MAVATSHPIRVQDWEGVVVPEGFRAEIIQGELVVTPSGDVAHGWIPMRLASRLLPFCPEGWGPAVGVEWRRTAAGVVAMAPVPDLVIIRRPERFSGTGPLATAPLLAVEVLSPSDDRRLEGGLTRREGKLLDYASAGLADYLEVDRSGSELCLVRYEAHDGALVAVDRRVGDEDLVADRPFRYLLRPADLV